MIIKEFFGRITLIRSIKRKELTSDNIFEACRVLALNEKSLNDANFTYEYSAFNHIITIQYDNIVDFGDSLIVQLILDVRPVDGNMRIVVTKRQPNKNYSYTIMFKDVISTNHIFDCSDPAFGKENIEDTIELISKALADKLTDAKRWY